METVRDIQKKYCSRAMMVSICLSLGCTLIGEKSIGKTSLLWQFKKILEGHNFYVFNVEITRSESFILDEFEFFKDLIDDIFERFAPPEGKFFDEEQSDIWFSLTRGEFKHDSNYIQRKIGFSTKYSNKMKGINERLSYKEIERDFSRDARDY